MSSSHHTYDMDLGVPERVIFPCAELDIASVEVRYTGPTGAAWPSGPVPIVTIEVSNDGIDWYGIQASGIGASAITFSDNGMTGNIDVSSILFLSARVSTTGASTNQRCSVTFYGRATGTE